jgi:hypothetical protein
MDILKVLEVAGWLIGLVVGIYGFVKFIDYRVEKVIRDPSFVKELSGSLRPYAIFDEKEIILVDRGAMVFIEAIEVRLDARSKLPEKIIVHPKVHLDQAPILIPLDTDMSSTKESRGKKFDWIYEIDYIGYSEREQRKFSIEVIK